MDRWTDPLSVLEQPEVFEEEVEQKALALPEGAGHADYHNLNSLFIYLTI